MAKAVVAQWPYHLAAGLGHTLAISEGKELYAWGLGNNGQLGMDSLEVGKADRSAALRPPPF
jgi:alpha-tubulin suppressor-like RCC1 family protein